MVGGILPLDVDQRRGPTAVAQAQGGGHNGLGPRDETTDVTWRKILWKPSTGVCEITHFLFPKKPKNVPRVSVVLRASCCSFGLITARWHSLPLRGRLCLRRMASPHCTGSGDSSGYDTDYPPPKKKLTVAEGTEGSLRQQTGGVGPAVCATRGTQMGTWRTVRTAQTRTATEHEVARCARPRDLYQHCRGEGVERNSSEGVDASIMRPRCALSAHVARSRGQEEPLVDLPCLTQPPTKSYWIVITQRHVASKSSGKEEAVWCSHWHNAL